MTPCKNMKLYLFYCMQLRQLINKKATALFVSRDFKWSIRLEQTAKILLLFMNEVATPLCVNCNKNKFCKSPRGLPNCNRACNIVLMTDLTVINESDHWYSVQGFHPSVLNIWIPEHTVNIFIRSITFIKKNDLYNRIFELLHWSGTCDEPWLTVGYTVWS